ncbi:hypothetical protein C8Q79DRAFT_1007745 [Trametes meyenii]|nr:hypothetical protein C8Q79DRAFT_1007745 [Trametes meyenii]
MPTVPPTYGLSADSFVSVPGVSLLTQADILNADERTSGPTPDPDTDDVVLLPVDQGNAVSQPSLERALPQTIKPRLDLGSLNLHSPSSIVGTPFDISPRFEYPFPASTCPPSYPSIYGFDPVVPTFPLTAPMTSRPSIAPPMPLTLPVVPVGTALPGRARGESRSFSPTHPKLQPRDPPVPPSLAKKRKLTKPSANDVASEANDAPASRPRAGSVNSVPERLNKLANQQQQQRGRALDEPRPPECSDTDKDRSQSLDTMRMRVPSQRHANDVIIAEQTRGGRDAISCAPSSRTLLLDSEPRRVAAEQPPLRPASVPPELSTRIPFDERLRSTLLVPSALRGALLPSTQPQDAPRPSLQ